MKRLLLGAMELHAHVTKGWDYDTWHDGRFLEQWADPRMLGELCSSFAHYEESDIKQALLNTVGLFRRIAREIAEGLKFTYPTSSDEKATWLVENYLSGQHLTRPPQV